MTLAQGGTLPSVLQSAVEALTWPPSSPLNKREKRKRRRRRTSEGRGERKRRTEIKRDRESRQYGLADRRVKGDRGD